MEGSGSGWVVRLCGPLWISVRERDVTADLPGRQGRLLLAYLAVNRERACPRSELIDVLWPEQPPAAADAALSALLSKLRRALGEGALSGRSELQLTPGVAVEVDVEQAAATARRAETALQDENPDAAVAAARAALAACAGAFLPDCDGPWPLTQRRTLDGVRVRAYEALAEASLGTGATAEAVDAARAAAALAPFRESAHRLLMEAHEAAGNPAEALRAFEGLRLLLREELGTAPGPAAMAVYDRILHGRAAPAPASAIRARSWPRPLDAVRGRHAFVGRSAEAGRLRDAWREAAAGARRLVVVAGDAGIGKTRLAAELADHAHADGAIVLYGRSDEEAPGAYQPVVEMLRGWAGGASLAPLAERLGSRAAELGIVLPEFTAPAPPDAGTLREYDLGAQRLRLFDALAALLAEIAVAAPLLVVLDDLHWADLPTLQLIGHLVRAPAPERTLFLATTRAGEGSEPLTALLAGLRRDGVLQRLELGGLDVAETGALVGALGGHPATPAFVEQLRGETDGNPFFIEEVVRHLADATGRLGDAVALDEAGVPEGVREVTGRRLARLGGSARDMLATAAVIGREFDFDVLEEVGPLRGDALVAALDEAVGALVLREDPERVGRYAFEHALMRATLYDGLSALRRARLHSRVGEALIAHRGAQLDPHLGQLAHHFALAAPVDRPERAVDFALAAGRRADRLLAWEEAAGHYQAALHARELAGATDDRLRCELLLALGSSQERAGSPEMRATFSAAAATARTLGDPALLGRAALGYAGRWSQLGRVEEDVAGMLQEALAGLGDEETPLRARLLARLALELYYAGDPRRRLALSEEAVTLARQLGDPLTLATCLDARHYALWRPETVHERLVVAAELRRIAEAVGDPELELEGAGWTVVDLLELGDVAGADIQIAAASRLAAALHRPLYEWWTSLFRCARAQIDGRFDEAERLAEETLAIGQRGQAENAVHVFAQAMFNIRREQGRLAEVEESVHGFIAMYPAVPAWRCTLALLYVELGREDAARREFESLAGAGFATLPRDAQWLIATTLLAEVCGRLGDAERAAELYDALLPYAGRNVIVGRASTCNGSASRPLGILAATMRDWERAERHFGDALAMHEAMRARPFVARTQVAWAETELARGDGAAARDRLAEAIVIADALGMRALGERARALVAGSGVGAA
jgi:DNA-binding SARP family transcriptional activator/tetratricopeptide (TPR) repeat protein